MNLFLEHSRTNITIIKKAWEEFVETGEIPKARPRSVIVDGWRACRQQGINPNIQRAPEVLESSELDVKLNCEDLGKAGKAVLDRIAPNTHNTKHVIVLADAKGQILYSVGHEQIQSDLETINFMPGGNWSIDQVGPNGVGTPIALDRPELIYGSEHYCQAWQPWVCYGSPIHDNSGRVIGCIDITGPSNDLSLQTMSLAISLSHSVESGLNMISLQKREYLRSVFQQRQSAVSSDTLLLIDDMGFVIDHTARTARLLGLDPDTIRTNSFSQTAPVLWEHINSMDSEAAEMEINHTTCDEFANISLIAEPVFYTGLVAGFIIIVKNITGEVRPDNFFPDFGEDEKIDLRSHGDQIIREALAKTNGNISKAARLLGINRTTIYRRLELLNKH